MGWSQRHCFSFSVPKFSLYPFQPQLMKQDGLQILRLHGRYFSVNKRRSRSTVQTLGIRMLEQIQAGRCGAESG